MSERFSRAPAARTHPQFELHRGVAKRDLRPSQHLIVNAGSAGVHVMRGIGMKLGDVVVTTQRVGGWSRPQIPEGTIGTVISVQPLIARFIVGTKDYELKLYPGEYR